MKGLGHASVLLWLALPFVVLANCSGPVVQYTGYQALAGVAFPAAQFNVTPGQFPDFGNDWWIVGIILLAGAGVVSAWRAGVIAAFVSIGIAICGLLLLQPAIGFFNPPSSAVSWTAEAGNGASGIGVVYCASILLDLGWMAGKSWSEVRRGRGGRTANHSDWVALSVFSTGFLILIGLAVLGLTAIVIAINLSSRS